jgi:hypothetical protein
VVLTILHHRRFVDREFKRRRARGVSPGPVAKATVRTAEALFSFPWRTMQYRFFAENPTKLVTADNHI